MIELPKRIGNISDTDYLQEQIDSMKHQLDNSVGGSTTTIANLSVENLEVKGKIDMGKNTSISWLNIKDADDVAYVESVEETKRAIKEVEEIAEQAKSTANSALGSVPTNYIPYSTYIDGRKVITESVAANNLLVNGGIFEVETGGGGDSHIILKYKGPSSGNNWEAATIAPGSIMVGDEVSITGGTKGSTADGKIKWSSAPVITVLRGCSMTGAGYVIASQGMIAGGKKVLTEGDSVSNATNATNATYATYATYGLHSEMTSNMYVGVSQSGHGNYRSFGWCGRDDFKSWLDKSSRTVKENILPLNTEWLEAVHGLYSIPVQRWNYTEENLNPGEHKRELIGIIAEDLEEVMPGAILYDKDGNVNSYNTQTVMNAMLVLLQEQNKRIEELERRLQVEPVE